MCIRDRLLDVYDLCEAVYLCATLEPERANDIFNIGAKEYTTMKEDYQAVLDYAGSVSYTHLDVYKRQGTYNTLTDEQARKHLLKNNTNLLRLSLIHI